MADAGDLGKMVPGFDFLQGLMKNAGAAIPGMGQWIAPTLDPKELEKRISELKTVQFWLEQNARLLAATIQALEVQRMTLSTLQTMNLPLADVRNALKINLPRPPAPSPAPADPATPVPTPLRDKARRGGAGKSTAAAAPAATVAAGAVDPLQWWGALTQQFTELATKAMQDSAGAAMVPLAAAQTAAKAAATSAVKHAAAPATAAPRKRRA